MSTLIETGALSWWDSLCISITQRAGPAGVSAPGRFNHAGQVKGQSPDKCQSHNTPIWGLSLKPLTSSSRKHSNVTETELRNSTSRCSTVVGQVTVSVTTESETIREAVTARPSAVDAKTKIKIGFWNVRTMCDDISLSQTARLQRVQTMQPG